MPGRLWAGCLSLPSAFVIERLVFGAARWFTPAGFSFHDPQSMALRLEIGPQRQQNCTDCHKENARPVRFKPQESHAAPSRLQSAANRPAGIRAAKRSPPNNSAHHVQDTAENEQRAKPDEEHF
jgi:hypothetical protein